MWYITTPEFILQLEVCTFWSVLPISPTLHLPPLANTNLFSLSMSLVFTDFWVLNHGPLSYHVIWTSHYELDISWLSEPKICVYTQQLFHHQVKMVYTIIGLRKSRKHKLTTEVARFLDIQLCCISYFSTYSYADFSIKKKKKINPGLKIVLPIWWHYLKVDGFSITTQIRHIPKGQWWRKILSCFQP